MLRARRARLGLTLARLAELAGCTKSYLSFIETGRRLAPPGHELLLRLEAALGLRQSELVTAARWDSTPAEVRARLAELATRDAAARRLAQLLRAGEPTAAPGATATDVPAQPTPLPGLAQLAPRAPAPSPVSPPQPRPSDLLRAPAPRAPLASTSLSSSSASSSPSAPQPSRAPRPPALPGPPSLDDLYRSGELKRLIDAIAPLDPDEPSSIPDAARTDPQAALMDQGGAGARDHAPASAFRPPRALAPHLPVAVPLINSVAAGYPADFTDLGYPARVADQYVPAPDTSDPDAFAARVVGDSMAPDYREGDIVIFSPARPVKTGCDCFVRLEPDHQTTFKRIYFESAPDGSQLIRLQPLNSSYPPQLLPRESIAGLYAATSVTRAVG
ncbi:MAG TPA: LexA family transcriptional regulator [Phycisphaerales bacterium]|nr:LexA family transcriptional regulator [Phycisphaerales bacterium]